MKKHLNRFEALAKYLLYAVAGMLPLWFVPWPAGVEAGREVSFAVVVLLAVVLWLLSVLSTGELRLQVSPILYISGILLIILAVSAILSKVAIVSFSLAEPIGERVFVFIIGFLLMMLVGSLLKKKEEVKNFVLVFVMASGASALINLLQLFFNFSVFGLITSFAAGNAFNVAGTQNGLTLSYALALAMCLGLITSGSMQKRNPVLKMAVYAAAAFMLINILAVDFQTVWIILLGVSIFLFGLISKNTEIGSREERKLDWRSWTAIGFLVLSVVMLLVKGSFVSLNLPAEVAPAPSTTFGIASKVFKEGPRSMLFGSGPGSFGLDWSKYKDPSINQTVFWSLRFNQGSSWVTTLLATTGVLGFAGFLALLGISLFIALKQIFVLKEGEDEEAISTSLLLGLVVLLITAVLYPSNLFTTLAFFAILGLISSHLSSSEKGADAWTVEEKKLKFTSPWAVFLSSLLIIFIVSMAITGLYKEFSKVRAAVYFQKGFDLLGQGELDKAIESLEKMTSADNNNFKNYQLLVQARMEKIKSLVARAAGGENVQQEFQGVISLATQNSQKAIELYPMEPSVWRTQGSLYEMVIPVIQGAERFAFDSYRKAADLDPLNPVIWADLGRAGLVFTERVRSAQSQANAADKEKLEKMRINVLSEVEVALQKAVEIKPDYAPAHFLLTQTALKLGNTQSAIRSAENTRLAAPFDVGVAFQLGLLYYQTNDLNRAKAEFERAVGLNINYSNARYFLGLIYDRQGDRMKAVEQFEKVAELNPESEEVKKILNNLNNNRNALAGISPPGEAPERRRTTPLEEADRNKTGVPAVAPKTPVRK